MNFLRLAEIAYLEIKSQFAFVFSCQKKEAIVGIRFSGVPHVNKIQWSISSEKDNLKMSVPKN